ncbi:LptE family protein [Spongiivirga sp. MCCC 1A20706]|uniref:LptE family protein n=1 Tax=Spongiivirga sp. MCCC 1A20706 TaxID=3160963 RepID=UPI003977305D
MKKQFIYLLLATTFFLGSCKYYNFTGGDPGSAESFQVTFIRNEAPIFTPGLDRDFTTALQDRIQDQTNLTQQNSNADLLYEGEIVEYRIAPLSAIADQNRGAAQNRLTMSVNIRFFNKTKPENDFEKRFSFFSDFPAATSIASVRQTLHEEIFERITQDIFQESLASW